MERPLIAITCRVADRVDDSNFPLERKNEYCLQTYVRAIQAAGGMPILLPSVADPKIFEDFFERSVDGLLIPGGGDLDPALYGENLSPECGIVRPLMDNLDLELASICVRLKIPVLGICRGMQALNVAFGGSLRQHMTNNSQEHDLHHKPRDHCVHKLQVLEGTLLAEVLGEGKSVDCNSLHHQDCAKIGSKLMVSARAEDGTVEGLELIDQNQYVVGVQCHPEELWEKHASWQRLFSDFVSRCAAWRS